MQSNQVNEFRFGPQIRDALEQDEAYYDDLQNFRKLYPDIFFHDDYEKDEETEESDPAAEYDDRYYDMGFFRVNERLFPERARHPFTSQQDAVTFVAGSEVRNLAEDEPPVKVSIPKRAIERTEKVFKPHRRRSFDPSESVDIGDVSATDCMVVSLLRRPHKTMDFFAALT
ncbi:hypothetical protein HK104_010879 [Borealophlyctis nickersoniae]|nr:hypothetical protein HK104_010879 [Borealophlyctis nickersoniae]